MLSIAETTLESLAQCMRGQLTRHELTLDKVDMVAAEEVTTHIVRGGLFSASRQVLEERPFFADTAEMREADDCGADPAYGDLSPAAAAYAREVAAASEAASRLAFLDLCPASDRRAGGRGQATVTPARLPAAAGGWIPKHEPIPPAALGGDAKAAAVFRRSQSLMTGSVRAGPSSRVATLRRAGFGPQPEPGLPPVKNGA